MSRRESESIREEERRPESRVPEREEEVLWEGKPALIAGIDSQTIKYRLTNRQLEVIHSGISKKVERIALGDVESVTVYQGLTEQTAGAGDVIVNVRGGARLVLEDLYHFERVRDIIQEAVSEQAQPAALPMN